MKRLNGTGNKKIFEELYYQRTRFVKGNEKKA
jgi:hypothetical protein